MTMAIRVLHVLVLGACLAAGTYYSVADNEAQGALVVLLGILYFVGVPKILPNTLKV